MSITGITYNQFYAAPGWVTKITWKDCGYTCRPAPNNVSLYSLFTLREPHSLHSLIHSGIWGLLRENRLYIDVEQMSDPNGVPSEIYWVHNTELSDISLKNVQRQYNCSGHFFQVIRLCPMADGKVNHWWYHGWMDGFFPKYINVKNWLKIWHSAMQYQILSRHTIPVVPLILWIAWKNILYPKFCVFRFIIIAWKLDNTVLILHDWNYWAISETNMELCTI